MTDHLYATGRFTRETALPMLHRDPQPAVKERLTLALVVEAHKQLEKLIQSGQVKVDFGVRKRTTSECQSVAAINVASKVSVTTKRGKHDGPRSSDASPNKSAPPAIDSGGSEAKLSHRGNGGSQATNHRSNPERGQIVSGTAAAANDSNAPQPILAQAMAPPTTLPPYGNPTD